MAKSVYKNSLVENLNRLLNYLKTIWEKILTVTNIRNNFTNKIQYGLLKKS